MTKLLKILSVLGLATAAACSSGGNSTSGTTGGTATAGSTTGTMIPAAPMLGSTQVDRMGRGAVNTALTAPLGSGPGPSGTTVAQPQAKDFYNSVTDSTQWQTDFAAGFVGSLAVYDALDGVCGNQLAAGKPDGGPAGVYGTLAGVLTDDQLYVDTAVTTCKQYLAVELEAVGIIPASSPKDCGGRTPTENIIDETYSALAVGALSGVSNGITAKAGGTANLTTFPFLGAP